MILYGRLIKKKHLKTISFLKILTPRNEIIQAVVESKDAFKKLNIGDVIRVGGFFKKTISPKFSKEFYVKSAQIIGRNYLPTSSHPFLRDMKAIKKEVSNNQVYNISSKEMKFLLELKTFVINLIREFFFERGFIEVHSPKIVDSMIEGPTRPFTTKYYNKKAFLSISNVLYHHMLVILGYNQIFEISPIFRQQPYNSRYQLSEFWTLDFTEAWKDRGELMKNTESLLYFIIESVRKKYKHHLKDFEITLPSMSPGNVKKVEYKEVLDWLKVKEDFFGSHLSYRLTKELQKRNYGMVWVLNAPGTKKPFFLKRKKGMSFSAELWTKSTPILASGGERVTDYKEALENIKALGLNSKNFKKYLDILKFGAPPCYTIGIGIERLIQFLTGKSVRLLVPFPRFRGKLSL